MSQPTESLGSTGELRSTFAKARGLAEAVEVEAKPDVVDEALKLMHVVAEGVRNLQVFSKNEEAIDVNTEDLQYVLVDNYLGQLYLKVTADEQADHKTTRLNSLKKAITCFDNFLNQCDVLRLVDPPEKKALEMLMKGEKMDASTKREVKIERFKRSKACKTQLKLLQTQMAAQAQPDEDLLRQSTLLLIANTIRSVLDTYAIAADEMTMLEQMVKLARLNPVEPPPTVPEPGKGISVTKIDAQFNVQREILKDGVFKPDWRQPTVSLEEYAEIEMERAKERARKEAENPGNELAGAKIETLKEKGLEDDLDLVDKATMNDREWDNWKDEHPKGSGNTKRY